MPIYSKISRNFFTPFFTHPHEPTFAVKQNDLTSKVQIPNESFGLVNARNLENL